MPCQSRRRREPISLMLSGGLFNSGHSEEVKVPGVVFETGLCIARAGLELLGSGLLPGPPGDRTAGTPHMACFLCGCICISLIAN